MFVARSPARIQHRNPRVLVSGVEWQRKRANRSGIAYDVPHPVVVTDLEGNAFFRPDFAFVYTSTNDIIH